MRDAKPDAGAQRFELGDGADAFERRRRAVKKLPDIIERGGKRVFLDIADEPVRREVGGAARRFVGFQIGGAGVKPERVIRQFSRNEAPGFRLVEHDDNIDFAPRQRDDLRHRHKLDEDAGMALDKIAQRASEIVSGETVGRADTHGAGQLHVNVADLRLRVQERRFHPLRGQEEAIARAGQRRASSAALEKFRAKPRLKRGDAAADRGVIQPQSFCRRHKLPAARDSEKHAHIVPIHPAGLTGSANICTHVARNRLLLCKKHEA